MADFYKYLPFLRGLEGEDSNHPNDPGGPTNHGITHITYAEYLRKKGQVFTKVKLLEKLSAISEAEIADIYLNNYWIPAGGQYIADQALAELLFDHAVNCGVGRAVKDIQMLCDIKRPDGIFGPITSKAVNAVDPKILFLQLLAMRRGYYNGLAAGNPENGVFLDGWQNRLSDIRDRWKN